MPVVKAFALEFPIAPATDSVVWKIKLNLIESHRTGILHGGAKPPLKCIIKAKFTYLLHFFSFLDQTCQIDFDCPPNNFKFLFDAKCRAVTSQRLTSPKWV